MIKTAIFTFFKFSKFLMYFFYDYIKYRYLKSYQNFFGWGIHLYVGSFGSGKTASAVRYVYNQCCKYSQLSVVTNINLVNFPSYTKIYKLNTVDDIINADEDCIVLIDEIGTIFNSRDFATSKSKRAVPKSLFQHLCQCRKRRMQIVATVQKYNLLDKQIRDISATVTVCKSFSRHPFSRFCFLYRYDADDYDMYSTNRLYTPRLLASACYVQTNLQRNLYDTSELVADMLDKEYLSDEEILTNRGDTSVHNQAFSKRENRKIRR